MKYISALSFGLGGCLVLNADTDTANNVHQIVRVNYPCFASELLSDMISNPSLFQDINPSLENTMGPRNEEW